MRQTVTIRNPRHLSLRDNRLVIREKDPESRSETALAEIPLSDIWVVIIDSPQITMTSALVSEMNDAGIGVMYCGRDHMPNGLCLPLGAHSRHAEIVEHQLAIPKPLRNQLWKRIVVSKILNQARALELAGRDDVAAAKVRGYAAEVHSDDRTRREAPAAADYFAAMLPYGTRREGPIQVAVDVFCESLRRAIELRDADMLLTPELIGLEMESADRMRARGRI